MDFDLSDYSKVVYDTNCIIYYRLNFSISCHRKKIRLTPKEFHIVDRITSQFLNKNYEIHTLRIAFDEIFRKGIATIIEEYLTEKYPNLRKGGFWIAMRHFEIKVTESIQELKNKAWFFILEHSPPPDLLQKIRNFYRSLPNSPAKQRLIDKNKAAYPDDTDLSLIIYSQTIGSPLLTNDRDIYDFKAELKTYSYCTRIISLSTLAHNSFS